MSIILKSSRERLWEVSLRSLAGEKKTQKRNVKEMLWGDLLEFTGR